MIADAAADAVDAIVLDDDDDDFLCPVCLLVLYDPIRTSCGHHYCFGCWERLMATAESENREPSCPTCRQVEIGAPLRDHARNREVRIRRPAEWERRYLVADTDARARARAINAEEAEAAERAAEVAEAEEEHTVDGRVTRRMGPVFLRRHAREQCTYRTLTLLGKFELALCGLRDLSPALCDYSMLTSLRLEHNSIEELAGMRLPMLKILSVHHNRLQSLGGDALVGVPQLLLLDAGANWLTTLDGVQHLRALATLNAPNNRLDGPRALAALAALAAESCKLSTVDLRANTLRDAHDLRPLTLLPELRSLSLGENPVVGALGRAALLQQLSQVRLLDGAPNAQMQRTERQAQLAAQREAQQRSSRQGVRSPGG